MRPEPSTRAWDFEGPVEEITIRVPKTQIADEHWQTFKIWQRVTEDVHPCAEVHFDNGVGVDGVLVRYKDSRSTKWQKIVAKPKGKKGKARVRIVGLGRRGYRFHRLVANAFYGMPIYAPAEVCHIIGRGIDEHPNDAAANIYVGTDATNKADRDSTGVPKPGKSIPFEGKRPGDELWTRFESQKEAAGVTGVKHGTVTAALRNGSSNTGPDEWTFRWIPMVLGPNEVASLSFDEARKRVLTSFGREGRIVRSGQEKLLTEVGGRGTLESGHANITYTDKQGVEHKGVYFHRMMVELFRPEWIDEAVKRTKLPWEKLDVDHIDHDESNNEIGNLRVLSRREHTVAQQAYPVEEIDAVTRKPFDPKRTHESANHAARALGLDPANVRRVCEKKRWTTGGKAFRYVDEAAVLARREARKRKRDENAVA